MVEKKNERLLFPEGHPMRWCTDSEYAEWERLREDRNKHMELSKPSAKIICDSISPEGIRLTTMEVRLHRFVLAELNTHRAFSRNAGSSRAIPPGKILKKIIDDPAMPIHWGREQKGMQSGESLTGQDLVFAKNAWINARDKMISVAEYLKILGLHKSLINRLLEPWMWVTDIVTFTEWDNFAWQRCDAMAQPEFKAAADSMQLEYYTHKPKQLKYGEWHLPYIKNVDWEDVIKLTHSKEYQIEKNLASDEEMFLWENERLGSYFDNLALTEIKKISIARCARVSYLNHDGIRDIQEDIAMYDNKLKPYNHPSPFEHTATPCDHMEQLSVWSEAMSCVDGNQLKAICSRWGNFYGWHQERKFQENENRSNFIPNLPELQHIADKMTQDK